MSVSESEAPPRPEDCNCEEDVGRLHHGVSTDVWYECVYETRHAVFVWVITPPVDDPLE